MPGKHGQGEAQLLCFPCAHSNQGVPFCGGADPCEAQGWCFPGQCPVKTRVVGTCGGVLECLMIWPEAECHLGTRLERRGEELESGSALQILISVSAQESAGSGPGGKWGTPSLGCGND